MSATAPAPVEAARRTRGRRPRRESFGAYAQRWWTGVKAGDLGSLPIIVGLIIIAIVFQTQNSNFLTAGNFVNLIVQAAAYALIGMGIVFVLLLGEIDLSVGYVSGVGGRDAGAAALPDGTTCRRRAPRCSSRCWPALAIGTSTGCSSPRSGSRRSWSRWPACWPGTASCCC